MTCTLCAEAVRYEAKPTPSPFTRWTFRQIDHAGHDIPVFIPLNSAYVEAKEIEIKNLKTIFILHENLQPMRTI